MSSVRRTDGLLFGFLFLCFAYFYQGGFANQNSRFDCALALAYEHRLTIDTFHDNTIDKAFSNGHYYSEKAPGTCYFAAVPAFVVSHFLSKERLIADSRAADGLLYLVTVLVVSLTSAGAAICFRRLLSALQPESSLRRNALLSSLVFLGTPMLPYSTVLMGHQLSAALLLAALYVGWVSRNAFVSGLLLGLAFFVEYPPVPLALGIAWVLQRKDSKWWKKATLGAIPPLCVLAWHNHVSFGRFYSLGYGKLQGTPFEEEMAKGLFGIGGPSLSTILQLLFGLYRGLFIYAPLLAMAVFVFRVWPSQLRRRFALPILLGAAGLVGIISGYGYWQGGAAFGPRHLVPLIPFLALGLAFMPRAWLFHPVFFLLAFASLLINLTATATNVFVSEWDPNPLFNTYFEMVRNSDVSWNPQSALTSFDEQMARWEEPEAFSMASWNLGEWMGLKGWFSLLPLAALALGFGLALYRTKSPELASSELPRPA